MGAVGALSGELESAGLGCRVVAVELNPGSKQGDLLAAITPVEDRLMKRYKNAQAAQKARVAAGSTSDVIATHHLADDVIGVPVGPRAGVRRVLPRALAPAARGTL